MWKFNMPVPVTKSQMLSLHELAGEDMSIRDYLEIVIQDHIDGAITMRAADAMCALCAKNVALVCTECAKEHMHPDVRR